MKQVINLDEEERYARLEYDETVKAAAAKRDKILDAIAILRGAELGNTNHFSRPTLSKKKKSNRGGMRPTTRAEGTVIEIVKETALTCKGEYTGLEAFGELKNVYPHVKMSVKAFQDKLSKLAITPDSGITVSSPRSGRIAAKYLNTQSVKDQEEKRKELPARLLNDVF